MSMREYGVVIERAEGNYSAYVPDLPGCIAVGDTIEETRSNIREAIQFHIEAMERDGDAIPEPTTVFDYVQI
jgi:predicted RNase H-like HicB family nuclease